MKRLVLTTAMALGLAAPALAYDTVTPATPAVAIGQTLDAEIHQANFRYGHRYGHRFGHRGFGHRGFGFRGGHRFGHFNHIPRGSRFGHISQSELRAIAIQNALRRGDHALVQHLRNGGSLNGVRLN